MSAAFSRLHPKIQEAVWNQQWGELRPLQVGAIQRVFDTEDHLILAAATASGKTEAAFLPLLSKIAEDPLDSIQALYISPLKALINDQFRRLEDLCQYADIPVHRWHGDVSATDKRRMRQSPGGILLITPESLESQFINYDRHLRRIYAHLRFVVIDELHAFLDNVRGIHLLSLLARLNLATGTAPRKFGLSATIGDFAPARSFLYADKPDSVCVIEDGSQQKELRVGLKAFLDAREAGEGASEFPKTEALPTGLSVIAADIAQRFRGDSNLIFCNSRRQTELLADKLNQMAEREHWPRNPFVLHHGSLSRELREDTESELKSGRPVTAICTSTLEMGIDIGSVRVIGQVGPTWSVSSLVQRLGRSGRKDGEPQILRIYTLDEPLNQHSSLTERLYPELIRAIALLELHREKWLEPPEINRTHFSTCVHQILSILRQTGGAHATHLHDALCKRGAFRCIEATQLTILLRGLAAHELIEQIPTGELILAPEGEHIVESHDFYAAFASRTEYRIEHDGQQIGVLPADMIPAEGEFLLLAGRRWRVMIIDNAAKRALVTPAKGWKQPRFSGDLGGLHPVVMARMERVLSEDTGYPYLHPSSSSMLSEARETFEIAGLKNSKLIFGPSDVQWFPWAGTKTLQTLELCAKADGIKIDRDELRIRYQNCTRESFLTHSHKVATGGFTTNELLPFVKDLDRDRFDEYVPREILEIAFAKEMLDIPTASVAARVLFR